MLPGSDKKILVVEDEDMLRNMLVTILKDAGYLVDEASDGEQASQMLSEKNYNLLITDLFMPVKNGFKLIQECLQLYPSLKTLLISGGGKELEAEHLTNKVTYKDQPAKVDLFMKKPCRMNELLGAVEKLTQ